MNTKKLKEALVELQLEREKLDGVISQLRNMIAAAEPVNGHGQDAAVSQSPSARSSYIEDAVKILGQAGKPMHVKEITRKIAEMRKATIARASVESSIVRHISLGARSQLAKFGPSTYGLPAWEQMIPKNPKNAVIPSFFGPDAPNPKQ